MIAIRILVDPSQPDDMTKVVHLQDKIRLCGPSIPAAATANDVASLADRDRDTEINDPAGFLHSLGQAIEGLAAADVPRWVTQAHDRLHRTVTNPHGSDDRGSIARGLERGLSEIAAHVKTLGQSINGWAISNVGTAFGNDHLLRAAVAYSQIYINPAAEALYPICEVDDTQAQLSGANTYTLTFPAGKRPPATYFWSLTVYHARGLLYDNDIKRYAITDRTSCLAMAPDGSLTIYIQTTAPSSDHSSNWLPCPPDNFRLMMRLYGPTEPTWTPPPVMRTSPGTVPMTADDERQDLNRGLSL